MLKEEEVKVNKIKSEKLLRRPSLVLLMKVKVMKMLHLGNRRRMERMMTKLMNMAIRPDLTRREPTRTREEPRVRSNKINRMKMRMTKTTSKMMTKTRKPRSRPSSSKSKPRQPLISKKSKSNNRPSQPCQRTRVHRPRSEARHSTCPNLTRSR